MALAQSASPALRSLLPWNGSQATLPGTKVCGVSWPLRFVPENGFPIDT